MAEPQRIQDRAGALALAERLNGERALPVVVVSVPTGRTESFIDVGEVFDQVGDLAEVYLLTSGPHTWVFSDAMPERTQVYGGAGRVYPVGHAWVTRPSLAPLRFAFQADEGARATQALIADVFRTAASAGLLTESAARPRRLVSGVVASVPVPERALVRVDRVDRDFAIVAQELTLPEVPLDRVLSRGMRVSGWYDPETRRLDLGESLRTGVEARFGYAAGEVVLARARSVEADRVELLLHPFVAVEVPRDRVTANDLDDLRTLFTPGEVLLVRVVEPGPSWVLTLVDVDDDEEPVPAVPVLPGGPPWLEPPTYGQALPAWLDEPEPEPELEPEPEPAPAPEPAPVPEPEPEPESVRPVFRPTPAMLDRRRPGGRPPVPAAAAPTPRPAAPPTPTPRPTPTPVPATPAPPSRTSAVATMSATIAALQAEVAALTARVAEVLDDVQAARVERDALIAERRELTRTITHQEHELQQRRSELRRAKQRQRRPEPAETAAPRFADAEQGFRHEVVTAWALRTPVAEQRARPLPEYDVGPDFLASVEAVAGVALRKVADVVVEVLTDRVKELPGRDLHQLRVSAGGGAAYHRRGSDGATCWRVALQQSTPSARRLHYWVQPGGRIELSRVALHDDVRP